MKKILGVRIIHLLLFAFFTIYCKAQIQQGDTVNFWSVTYIDWPPLAGEPQRSIESVCSIKGQHCYLMVETSILQSISSSALQSIVTEFDNSFYSRLTALYGPVPDTLDGDSMIYILVFNESNWWGYFDPGQQMPDTFVYNRWNRHSNEKEILYIAGSAVNSNAGGEVVAHEFGHMLHWNQDHTPEPAANPVKFWEEAWIDEGFSTFAAMYLTEDIYQSDVYHSGAFFANNPDKSLIYFEDYDLVQLWSLFMFEHYGGEDYLKTLIAEPLNGISGMKATLNSLGYSETFDEVFRHWVLTNYLDNASFQLGKYSYSHYNFGSPFISQNINTIPSGLKNASVKSYASDYIHINSTTAKPSILKFYSSPVTKFQLSAILLHTTGTVIRDLIYIDTDSTGYAEIILDSLGSAYNRVVFVVMNIDSAIGEGNSASYSYRVDLLASDILESEDDKSSLFYPNPSQSELFYSINNLNNDLPIHLEITDILGKTLMIKSLDSFHGMIDISALKQGCYYLKVQNKSGRKIYPLIKQ